MRQKIVGYTFKLRILLILFMIVLLVGLSPENLSNAQGGGGGFNFIFAADTADDYVKKVYEESSSPIGPSFYLDNHWNPIFTASNDGTSSAQGEALTLRWSIIPDGTLMPGYVGEATCASTLIADLDDNYGSGNWENEIANVFADWATKTGNKYIRELNDDGATWPTSTGVLNTRGDIRLGGCTIDGDSGILAYNFYPSTGDMKIDSPDSYYGSASLATAFHNVISHEHGHGAGIEHVCPVNKTKLMEPFITTSFKGLQHDDIRAVQRHYGDYNELIGGLGNDISARATVLGSPTDGVAVDMLQVSIDDDGDEDWYSFSAANSGKQVSVSLSPVGLTYLNGSQNGDGSCSAGTNINSLVVHNLNFEIIDSDGSTVIASGNSSPAGVNETLTDILLGLAGTKYIRVVGDSSDDIQLYDLQITVTQALPSLTKSASLSSVTVGNVLTYTLVAKNNSLLTASNILITDTIPANTTYVNGSASNGGSSTGTAPGSIISWSTGLSLAQNEALTRTFVITVDNELSNGTSITNIGYLSATNISASQSSNTVVTTVDAPDLSTSITSNPNPILAETAIITYTITLANNGGAAATGVNISNTIPSSTTFIAATHSGSETWPGSKVITWPTTTVNVASFITRVFFVSVTESITDGDVLTNVVSVSSAEGNNIQDYAVAEIVGPFIYFPIIFKNN